jgi:hypothetical protein
MIHHFGTAHSCWSFADLVIKNIQRFKAKLEYYRWMFFMTRLAKSSSYGLRRNDGS